MTYPYRLVQNPYPSNPTPAIIDTQVLGGNKHKEARSAVLSCIEELDSKVIHHATTKEFRLITVIQDVGSGKTHLAFHIKGLPQVLSKAVISYTDLAQVFPRSMQNIYGAILRGFNEEYLTEFRRRLIYYLKDRAERDRESSKKIFHYRFLDSITGKKLEDKVQEILHNKALIADVAALQKVLDGEFSRAEIAVMKLVIDGKFTVDNNQVNTLDEILGYLSALAALNLKFFNKLTLLEIDELDAEKESMGFVKAIINAHLPSTGLLLILTPLSYEQIRTANSSVFDRLEKANYKIDLAGSNTLEEIVDIVLEYIRYYDKGKNFGPEDEKDLNSKIKAIYDEFPDFRNVRSMINILYHATEDAAARNSSVIDEEALEETVKKIYPGLRIKGSIMSVPVSDFIKIQKGCIDVKTIESDVRAAVRNLVTHAQNMGTVSSLEGAQENADIDVIYSDAYGSKVAVALILNQDGTRNYERISSSLRSSTLVDKVLILTDYTASQGGIRGASAAAKKDGETVVNIDRSKIVDLLYFSSIYKTNEIRGDDLERALALAKSIKLC
jgi:Ni2+-binding GTPase involved in maturation of urease and hydrogenase